MSMNGAEGTDGPSPMLLDRLAQNASRSGDKVAVTFLGNGPGGGKIERQMTYREVETETDALAQRLLGSGIKGGDRAVLVYPPSLDFMVAFLACLKAGIVAVPVFPPNPSRKDTLFMFSRIVEGCGAKHALTSAKYNHMKSLAGIKDAFARFKKPANASAWPEDLEWIVTDSSSSKKPVSSAATSPVELAASDLAFLQYTSGSTSEPKGVMITHGNLAHNLTIITNELQAGPDNTIVVSWLPQYHDMGLIGSYLGVLYCGGSGYYMSPLSFLQRPMLWMEAVSKFHATHLQAPNFAFKLTSRKFDAAKYDEGSLDLSSVRHIINAAEPVDEESIDAFTRAFQPFGLRGDVMFPTYGLAEHTVFVCSGGTQRLTVRKRDLEVDGVVKDASRDSGEGGSDDDATSRLVGCGYPARQGVGVRIVNTDTMTEVSEDVVGEIWIQSPSKAAGYFNKAEETEADFHARLAGSGEDEGEGDSGDDASANYLRTGDLGFFHEDELFICGRLKDLIIVGGRNYYPQDIEATAEASTELVRPGCSAAFSIDPIHEGGEEVALVMELREVPKPKEVESVCSPIVESIRSVINQEHSLGLASIVLIRPRTVPKTTSGKIARAWCRKAFVNNTLDTVYRRTFKEAGDPSSDMGPLEIEHTSGSSDAVNPEKAEQIRALDKKSILAKLVADVSRLASIPADSIDTNAALTTILDSLSISQFKGMLEQEYATKLSDEYLFRDTTNLDKLVEVVKLGYAPDDSDEDGGGEAPKPASPPKSGGGLAGALGCPPGVVCCVVM